MVNSVGEHQLIARIQKCSHDELGSRCMVIVNDANIAIRLLAAQNIFVFADAENILLTLK